MESLQQRFEGLKYLKGLGNGFESEAVEGVIPKRTYKCTKTKIAQLNSN